MRVGNPLTEALRVDVIVCVSRADFVEVIVPIFDFVVVAEGVTLIVSFVDPVGVRVAVIVAETELVEEPVRELVIVFVSTADDVADGVCAAVLVPVAVSEGVRVEETVCVDPAERDAVRDDEIVAVPV